jgi:hypothetical protein
LTYHHWAAEEIVKSLSASEAIRYCRTKVPGSANWRAAFLALANRPKKDVLPYVLEMVLHRQGAVRHACYTLCYARGWEELGQYAEADKDDPTFVPLPNSDDVTLGLMASKYIRVVLDKQPAELPFRYLKGLVRPGEPGPDEPGVCVSQLARDWWLASWARLEMWKEAARDQEGALFGGAMRKQVWLLGLGIAMLAVPVSAQMSAPPPGVSKANCERLRPGMTSAHVESLFGKPARKAWHRRDYDPPLVGAEALSWLGKWEGQEAQVSVWFDKDGKVRDAFWESPPNSGLLTAMSRERGELSRLGRLRSWLGW